MFNRFYRALNIYVLIFCLYLKRTLKALQKTTKSTFKGQRGDLCQIGKSGLEGKYVRRNREHILKKSFFYAGSICYRELISFKSEINVIKSVVKYCHSWKYFCTFVREQNK